MMPRARQAILTSIAIAALIMTASACEGAAQPAASTPKAATRPGTNPLKALTSYQIIGKAFADTEAALNVQLTGKVTRSGQSTRLSSLSLVNGGTGCIGDIYRSGAGSFQLIYDSTTAWILPSPDYWRTAGKGSQAVVPAVEGKYLQVKPDGKSLGTLVGLCSLTSLAGTGPSPARRTGFGEATPTVVGTLPALEIPDTADGGYAIVSDTARPRLLRFFVPGRNGGDFRLSYSAVGVTMAAPPATEVLDGSKYGF